MDHYVDIRVLPAPELVPAHVVNAVANKLHLMLARLHITDVGMCFPRFTLDPISLGNTLRLHGNRARLRELLDLNWLTGLLDYVEASAVLPVPATAMHRTVRRVQTRSSAERVRRRQMRRHGWTEQEARERVPASIERRLNFPYLSLQSRSTGQPFRLFIDHQDCTSAPKSGDFNAYGLSAVATVPWF